MLRPAFLLLVFALPGAQAQQVEPHGPPASVLSPTSPGQAHGAPASVLSPTPVTGAGRIVFDQRRFPVRFGRPLGRRDHRTRRDRNEFIPVPIFIPAYGLPDYVDPQAEAAASEEYAPDANAANGADSDALREAYFRGAHDAMARQQADSRYGDHYLDSRENSKSKPSASEPSSDDAAKPEPADQTPPTIFIFKDGHKLQTQNYAIVGQTLYDLSNNQVHKIQLAELDLDATKKANDDLGIVLRLP